MLRKTPFGSSTPEYVFEPNERPAFPGSPYAPKHSTTRRACYFLIAVLAGVTSNLVNSMVTANLPSLAGTMGLYVSEAAWLPAIYVAFNATANLVLIKARAQFGILNVTYVALIAYVIAIILELAMPSFGALLFGRACAGVSMAALSTLTLYNMIQVVPASRRPLAFLIGISIPQLGFAVARIMPVDVLSEGAWTGLHLIELSLVLGVLSACIALPIPQSDRARSFEPLDALTIGLLVPASLLLCGVLGVGRYVWWGDAPWLGWAVVAAVPLVAVAIAVEHLRATPLIHTRWIGTVEMLRFSLVAALVRIALAEQTYGSVGLLTFGGLINDQMRALFVLVGLSMIAGIVIAALVTRPERITVIVMSAAIVIGSGAWLDTDVSSVSRAPQLFLSQSLIGFGTTLFIGPSLLHGFGKVMERGTDHVVTFIVLFGATQNVGGLAGSALLGSLQIVRVREHVSLIGQRMNIGDPIVAERLRSYAASYATVSADAAQMGSQGSGQLSQLLTREANILAFADVFSFVALLAFSTAALLAVVIVLRTRRNAKEGSR